jgi:hypothetical protein
MSKIGIKLISIFLVFLFMTNSIIIGVGAINGTHIDQDGSQLSLPVSNPNVVGNWSFIEGNGTYANDTSGNNNNGTLMNFDLDNCWVGGIYETGLRFDGADDHIVVPHSDSLNLSENVTVEVWAKAGYIELEDDPLPQPSIPISNITQLQMIGNNSSYPLNGDYHLTNDIDAAVTFTWNSGKGFDPIGNKSNKFTGTFDGRGFTISRLYINRPTEAFIGLLGYVNGSTITNMATVKVDCTGKHDVGGLIGSADYSTITDSYTKGVVKGNGDLLWGFLPYYADTGGLIGNMDHCDVYSSYSDADISEFGTLTGSTGFGGLIGNTSYGRVEDCYTTGNINITEGRNNAGGLIGMVDHTYVSNCFSTGKVKADLVSSLGGLVGSLGEAKLINSYSTGDVFGSKNVGGLVGRMYDSMVFNCYSSGYIEGRLDVGGLVGYISEGTISHSHSTGRLKEGFQRFGGLVGQARNSEIYNSYTDTSVDGNSNSQVCGGFAGQLYYSTVSNCFSDNAIWGYNYVGGFVGMITGSIITNSWCEGDVMGFSNKDGFLALVSGSPGTITSCYTSGLPVSNGGTYLVWPQQINQSTYVGYDFEFYWSMTGKWGFPELQRPWYTLIKKGGDGFSMHLNEDASKLKAGIGNKYLNVSVSNVDQWHHYVMTYNGTNISAYQDGIMRGTVDVGNQSFWNETNLTIGGDDAFFYGAMDEIRIINGTLNETEVKDRHDTLLKPPMIITTNVTTAYEDIPYQVDYQYTDINNDMVTWLLKTNASFLDIDPDTGMLMGNPTQVDIGTYWVNITCFDGTHYSTPQNFTLKVVNTNDMPVITMVNVETVFEDVTYSVDYEATDVDPGPDVLVWNMTTDAAWLSINTATGVLSGTPVNADVGIYSVSVWVNDGTVDVYTNFTVEVVNVNDDPIIDTVDVLSVDEDAYYSVDYDGYDVDPTMDVLTWNMTTNATWLNMTDDHLYGFTTQNQSGKSYWVNITLSDGIGGLDWTNFTLRVNPVNDAPEINFTPETTATEDLPYSVKLTAGDVDGDTLMWYMTAGPDWLGINGTMLEGTPANKDVGITWVTIKVMDSAGAADDISFSIEVANTNDAPVWVTVLKDQNITEGDSLYLTAVASDIDAGNKLNYSISSVPNSGITINSKSGAITWGDSQKGDYKITVFASDGIETINQTFNLTIKEKVTPIEPINKIPTIDSISDQETIVGTSFELKVTGSDQDTGDVDKLVFSLTQAPTGMVISKDGSILWIPNEDQIGEHNVTVSISDGKDSNSTSFVITVKEKPPIIPPKNNPPTITPVTEEQEGKAGEKYTVKITGVDSDAVDTLTFTLQDKPSGMVISKDGEILWIPQDNQMGTHTVIVALSDGKNTTTTSFDVTVEETDKVEPSEDKEFAIEEGMPYLIILLIVGLIIGLLIGMMMARKKKPAGEIEEEEEEEEAEEEEDEELEDEELEDEELEEEEPEEEDVPEDEVSEDELEEEELDEEEDELEE